MFFLFKVMNRYYFKDQENKTINGIFFPCEHSGSESIQGACWTDFYNKAYCSILCVSLWHAGAADSFSSSATSKATWVSELRSESTVGGSLLGTDLSCVMVKKHKPPCALPVSCTDIPAARRHLGFLTPVCAFTGGWAEQWGRPWARYEGESKEPGDSSCSLEADPVGLITCVH